MGGHRAATGSSPEASGISLVLQPEELVVAIHALARHAHGCQESVDDTLRHKQDLSDRDRSVEAESLQPSIEHNQQEAAVARLIQLKFRGLL